jgi:hypothetical protein
MQNMDDHPMRNMNQGISRRRFLGRLLATGVTVAVGQAWFDLATSGSRNEKSLRNAFAEAPGSVAPAPICSDGQCLSSDEFRVLEALVTVVIPSDDHGPGAREAGVAQRVHQTIFRAEPVWRRYVEGLRAIDAVARKRYHKAFAELSYENQRDLFIFLEEAYGKLWPQIPPTTFSGKVQWKLHHLYYRQIAGVSDPALIMIDQVTRDAAEAFYSTSVAWESLGYSGPPFPFGYAGRARTCALSA